MRNLLSPGDKMVMTPCLSLLTSRGFLKYFLGASLKDMNSLVLSVDCLEDEARTQCDPFAGLPLLIPCDAQRDLAQQ